MAEGQIGEVAPVVKMSHIVASACVAARPKKPSLIERLIPNKMAFCSGPGSVFPLMHAEIAIQKSLTTQLGVLIFKLSLGRLPRLQVNEHPVKEVPYPTSSKIRTLDSCLLVRAS